MQSFKTSKQQQGFTMIELIIVIVLIGILSAVALPRFINSTSDAHIASVNGLAGGLRSATALVQSAAVSSGQTGATGNVSMMNGVVVAVANGFPTATAAGITAAMQDTSGYSVTYASGVATFQAVNGGSANCSVSYTAATGAVATTTTGC